MIMLPETAALLPPAECAASQRVESAWEDSPLEVHGDSRSSLDWRSWARRVIIITLAIALASWALLRTDRGMATGLGSSLRSSAAPALPKLLSSGAAAFASTSDGSIVSLAERANASGARQPAFCKMKVDSPVLPAALRFEYPGEWRQKCRSQPHPPVTGARPGTDWCWEFVKRNGCYANHGYGTWQEDQAHVAVSGQAPTLEQFAMEPLGHPEVCEHKRLGATWPAAKAESEETAGSWLRRNVAVYVVSLPEADDRRKMISERLEALRIEFKIIEGVDMTKPSSFHTAQTEGLVPKSFNRSLRGVRGTVGCAAAHLRALRNASQASKKPLALILEDDVWLHAGFAAKLQSLVELETPCNWQVLSLKSRCPLGSCVSQHLLQVAPYGGEPGVCHGVNFGFFAMLYRRENLSFIRQHLERGVWEQKCLDVDVALAGVSDKVAYYAVPGVQQPGLVHEMTNFKSLRQSRNQLDE